MLPEDDEGMFAMDSDPLVHRYLGKYPVASIEESRMVIDFVRGQYHNNGIGRWAVALKETGKFIGWTGFKQMEEMVNGFIGHYDFGYRFAQPYWGKGLATEASRAALQFGIETMGLKNIYAMTDVDNEASRHVLDKLGFRLVEIFAYDGEPGWRAVGQPTTWYKLYAEPGQTGTV
jgi:RimJ/RimL family protein N-acetyltransferase